MKNFLSLFILLASTQSMAKPLCQVQYAAGLSHVFTGQGVAFADREFIKAGETVADEFYTVSVSEKGLLTIKETKSGAAVELLSQAQGEMMIYATKSLQNRPYPQDIPGTFVADRKFIISICAEESALQF